MVVILNFCLKVYYFIVISGRGGPHVGGHLFNPPTHRHKRGCLRTPTVLRIKFSKKKSRFSQRPPPLFFPHALSKKFSKKIFIIFPKATLIIFTITFLKKNPKNFSYIFQKAHSIFLYLYFISYFHLVIILLITIVL